MQKIFNCIISDSKKVSCIANNLLWWHWATIIGVSVIAVLLIMANRRRARFNIESRANGLSIDRGEGKWQDPKYRILREVWYNPFSRKLGIRIKLPPGRIIETFVRHSKAYSDIFDQNLGAPTPAKGGWYLVPRTDFDEKKN